MSSVYRAENKVALAAESDEALGELFAALGAANRSEFIPAALKSCLTAEEKELVKAFFEDFGKADLDGEIRKCKRLEAALEAIIGREEPGAAKTAKMHAELGLMAGAAFLIITA